MPLDYTQAFGNTPFALEFGMQDMYAEKEKAQQQAETTRLNQESTRLSNMYNEQMNPLKVQSQQMENDYTSQIQPIKITSELADYAKKAKQNELEMMEILARKMALSNDPKESAEGIRMMGLTKEFYKIREQTDSKVKVEETKGDIRKEVEAVKAKLRPPKVVGGGGGGPKPLGSDKIAGQVLQQAVDAQKNGDTETANRYLAEYEAIKRAGSPRIDSRAGNPTLQPDGSIGQIPPRPAPAFVPRTSAPAPKTALPAGAKQVGTHKGKPVYEINGKRFLME
jgi:hypothetical protein